MASSLVPQISSLALFGAFILAVLLPALDLVLDLERP